MKTTLGRTRSTFALATAVICFAAGSLAGAPAASACPIDTDGNCLITRLALRPPTAPQKPKAAKPKKAPIRHSASRGTDHCLRHGTCPNALIPSDSTTRSMSDQN